MRSGWRRGDEIDTAGAVWTVSAERVKAKREHRVPLSVRALAILSRIWHAKPVIAKAVRQRNLTAPPRSRLGPTHRRRAAPAGA